MGKTSLLAALASGACVLGGCTGPSLWERTYQGVKAFDEPPRATAPLPTLRDVSWERLMDTRAELERDVAASDVHPSEWPADKRDAAKATLLRGLQVQENPADVQVLGLSQFSTTDNLRADSGELATFGASLGATRVIYSTRFLGKADKIIDEPVTTYYHGGWHRVHDRRYRSEPWSHSSTTWVPIRVQADEHGWIVYYLKDVGQAGAIE
jgi:hypothetical protein